MREVGVCLLGVTVVLGDERNDRGGNKLDTLNKRTASQPAKCATQSKRINVGARAGSCGGGCGGGCQGWQS